MFASRRGELQGSPLAEQVDRPASRRGGEFAAAVLQVRYDDGVDHAGGEDGM
ncbi:hypothetical protein SDC9_33170 [bioreactor metagenome]|uniref:Uncharacterized protein n=1 Tax=bioreactor metagenome TaxID=1076179 RepID=A0A644V751_9ZZZZ